MVLFFLFWGVSCAFKAFQHPAECHLVVEFDGFAGLDFRIPVVWKQSFAAVVDVMPRPVAGIVIDDVQLRVVVFDFRMSLHHVGFLIGNIRDKRSVNPESHFAQVLV